MIARMIDELDVVTSRSGELERLIEAETAEDRSSTRREGMLRAIGLGARSATMKNLATAAKTLSEINGSPQGKKAIKEHEKLADLTLEVDAKVVEAVAKLKEKGLVSPMRKSTLGLSTVMRSVAGSTAVMSFIPARNALLAFSEICRLKL